MLNNQDTILIKNAEKKTAEKGSNDLISLKKECIRAKKDYEKKMQQINSVKLKKKTDCISFIIEKDKELFDEIVSIPDDEIKVVFCEIINSNEFHQLFHSVLNNSERLSKRRKSKADKAEKRKLNAAKKSYSTESEQTDETVQFPQLEMIEQADETTQFSQMEMIEQNEVYGQTFSSDGIDNSSNA